MGNREIILISDARILQIPIQENNDLLVDLRIVGDLKIDNRKQHDSDYYFYLRRAVVDKLLNTQKSLPTEFKFLIIEGLRGLSVQKMYFDEYTKKLAVLHSDWDKEKIYKEVSRFVAPPEITPPHSTGGAVDITLIDSLGKELDMGTEINADPEVSKGACFTNAENISQIAKNNRKILIEVMAKNGFVNYPTEWWHWSYGDRYWAYYKKQPYALFGAIR